jgi:hypothetical protein
MATTVAHIGVGRRGLFAPVGRGGCRDAQGDSTTSVSRAADVQDRRRGRSAAVDRPGPRRPAFRSMGGTRAPITSKVDTLPMPTSPRYPCYSSVQATLRAGEAGTGSSPGVRDDGIGKEVASVAEQDRRVAATRRSWHDGSMPSDRTIGDHWTATPGLIWANWRTALGSRTPDSTGTSGLHFVDRFVDKSLARPSERLRSEHAALHLTYRSSRPH